MRFTFYTSLILSYFINIFLQSELLSYLTGLIVLICIVISFRGAMRLMQIAGSIFFLIGLGLFIQAGHPIVALPYYVTSTVPILGILYVVPFINSVIVVGRYDKNVSKLMETDARHVGQIYSRGSFVSFALGGFLNLGTIPLVVSVFKKTLKDLPQTLTHKLIARGVLRGYALSLAISPMEILVAISIDITGINYMTFFPWLVFIVVILLLSDWAISRRYRKDAETEMKRTEPSLARPIRKTTAFFLFLIVFIGLVMATSRFFHFGFLETVSLAIIPYSLLWSMAIGRFKRYVVYCLGVWKERTLGLTNFMFLFLSIGLFTSILKDSEFIHFVQKPVEWLSQTPPLLFVAIQIMFIALAMIGFHPLVTISLLGSVSHIALETINPLSLAIVLTTSGLSTVSAGPFNLSVALTGELLRVSPYQVSWWNLGYAFFFSGVGSAIAWLLL